MKRTPEPELMDEEAQVRAYAQADFAAAHSFIIDTARELLQGEPVEGWGLDLGCGPGDMTGRLLNAFPQLQVEGVDGGPNMLRFARAHLQKLGLSDRSILTLGLLPEVSLQRPDYDFIFSNSLLHHLPNPATLWGSIKKFGREGTLVFVCDLLRPESEAKAREIVKTYSEDESEVLKKDFYNSLLAAYRPAEVRSQLEQAGLSFLTLQEISDRHLVVFGKVRR